MEDPRYCPPARRVGRLALGPQGSIGAMKEALAEGIGAQGSQPELPTEPSNKEEARAE
jgi:hypothetical protein